MISGILFRRSELDTYSMRTIWTAGNITFNSIDGTCMQENYLYSFLVYSRAPSMFIILKICGVFEVLYSYGKMWAGPERRNPFLLLLWNENAKKIER